MPWKSLHPTLGIVLGSGLGSFVDQMEIIAAVGYDELEDLPQSRVAGHAGRFVFGKIGDVPMVVADGRVHLYEGWSAREVTAQVRWLAERGVTRLVLTNAAGACHSAFTPGHWMMLTNHLNLTHTSPLLGRAAFHDMSEIYSASLRAHFAQVASTLDLPLYQGVYAGVIGPQYETPAEVRMLQRLGADAIGMSTVLEAIEARALGMEVAGFSCLTNWAAGLQPGALTHEDVLATGRQSAEQFARLLAAALPALAT